MNNKTIGIVLTIATVLLCGCPGAFLIVMGALAAAGSQMPSIMEQQPGRTPEEVILGAVMFLCVGAILIVIPIVIGIITLRMKSNTPNDNGMLPPMS